MGVRGGLHCSAIPLEPMSVPRKTVLQVLERDHGLCVIAGPLCLGEATEPDHRANRGAGGSKLLNDVRCLIAACGLCNGWKTTVHGDDRDLLIARGVIVEKAATNAGTLTKCQYTPLIYPDGSGYWLLNVTPWRVTVTEPPPF